MDSLYRASIGAILCTALAASAQVAGQPVASDSAWQTLQSLTSTPTAGGQSATLSQEISQLQKEALQANSFYTTFPSDPRANVAKKLEALSSLQQVQLGASAYQAAALALASAYVNDASQAVQDRFDVALAGALTAQVGTLKGMGPATNGAAYETLADGLHSKFGDVPPVYNYYLGLTLSADNATALDIASRIQTMNSPDWAKARAQVVINRALLVGGPVQLTLTNASNQNIDLSQASGQITVVYFWGGAASTNDLALLNSIKASVPAEVRWIYVALNSPSPSLAAVQAIAPISGIQCFDPVDLAGWVPQILFLQTTPYVYVFKADGNLSGYGPPATIPALLNAASQ